MSEVVIVTPIEITKRTPLGGNVDIDKYAYLIPDQQLYVLEPILGSALLDKILGDIETLGIDNLTGHYKAITFNYLKPILIKSVFAKYIRSGSLSIDNNGVFKVLPADSESAPQEEILSLVSDYKNEAQVFVDRLQKYLCDKRNEIPEYRDAQPNDYDIKPKPDSLIAGGLYLKRTTKTPWYLQDVDK